MLWCLQVIESVGAHKSTYGEYIRKQNQRWKFVGHVMRQETRGEVAREKP